MHIQWHAGQIFAWNAGFKFTAKTGTEPGTLARIQMPAAVPLIYWNQRKINEQLSLWRSTVGIGT